MQAQVTSTMATAWAALPDIDEVEPRSASDDPLFREIRDVLARHGALHRFGLMLNHRHFAMAPGEVIFETTDVQGRRQIIEPRRAADLAEDPRVLETQWMFDGREGPVVCVGFCHDDRVQRRGREQSAGRPTR